MEISSRKYETFWRRLVASIVDNIIFLVALIILAVFIRPFALDLIIVFLVVGYSLWFYYRVKMHVKYGQTIGKMLLSIIVLDADERRFLSTMSAFRRELIPICIVVLSTTYIIYTHPDQTKIYDHLPEVFSTIDSAIDTSNHNFTDKIAKLNKSMELLENGIIDPYKAVKYVDYVWLAVVGLTIFLSSKQRAIHDMIAKSVVVRKEVWDRENEDKHLTEGEDNGSHTS